MRARALHPDVLVVTSALLHVNCVIVRGTVAGEGAADPSTESNPVRVIEPGSSESPSAESFAIDSPVLPDELDALPSLLEQARFPRPSGLLATHGDWDHLLGRLAFPDAALGCAESTAERLRAEPGEAQRALRSFDEELMIPRARPLSLGDVQALPVPGRCEVGEQELELHEADGHTPDGMVLLIGWAEVLVAGDYLSTIELPVLGDGGHIGAYTATLERLRPLLARVRHVVPGHGPVLDREQALTVLEEDLAYLAELAERGPDAHLPDGRRGAQQRALHSRNAATL